MSKSIFLTNRVQGQVQRFGKGGLFQALTDPAASAFNVNPLFTSGQYVPVQAPMPPMMPRGGMGGAPRGGAAKPASAEELKVDKVHANAAGLFQDQYRAGMAELQAQVDKYGQDFLLTPQAQQLIQRATAVDKEQLQRAQNAFEFNKTVFDEAKERNNELLLTDDGKVTMLDDKGKVREVSVAEYAEKKAAGWHGLTNAEMWQLRENPNFDRDYAFRNGVDVRGLRLWGEADKNIREKIAHGAVGSNSNAQDGMPEWGQIGNIVGIAQGKRMDKDNINELKAAVDNLINRGGLDRSDYMAYVRNFVKDHGDIKDKKGKTVDQYFGEYITTLRNSQRVQAHEREVDFTGNDKATDLANAPMGQTESAWTDLGAQMNGTRPVNFEKIEVGGTAFMTPSAEIHLPEEAKNFDHSKGAYKSTIRGSAYYKALGDIDKAQLPTGATATGDFLDTFMPDDRENPKIQILPVRNGKLATQLPKPLSDKLQEITLQYNNALGAAQGLRDANAQQQALKSATERYQSRTETLLKRNGFSTQSFVKVTGTAALKGDAWGNARNTWNRNTGKGEKNDFNPDMTKIGQDDPNARRARATLVDQRVRQGTFDDDGVATLEYHHDFFQTSIYIPFDGDKRRVVEADGAFGGIKTGGIKGVQNTAAHISREQGGKLEFPVRTPEAPAFSFKPITLQDLY